MKLAVLGKHSQWGGKNIPELRIKGSAFLA